MTEKVICPHCQQEVEAGWLCSKCGQPLSTTSLLADDPIPDESPTSTYPSFSEPEPPAAEPELETEASLDEPEPDQWAPAAIVEEPALETEDEPPPEFPAEPEIPEPQEEPTAEAPIEAEPEQQEAPVVDAEPAVEEETEDVSQAEQFVQAETATDEPAPEPQAAPPPAAAVATPARLDLPSLDDVIGRVRTFFTFSGNTPDVYWRIVAIGLGLVLLAMLAGSAGLAILIGILILPVVILRYLSYVDLYETEPWWGVASSAGAGLLGGLIIGGIGHFITDRLWIEDAALRVGAAGFAGAAADAAGAAPFSVMILCGLLLPALAEAAKLAGPIFLRQWPYFRNEVLDGITLSAAAGCGFAAGTAIIHFWPVITRNDSVGIGLSEWTGSLLGIVIVRTVIQVATTALLGAAVWRYTLTQSTAGLIMPVAAGAGGAVFYGLSDIIIQPAGTTLELFWSILVALVLLYFLRIVIRQARMQDAAALGGAGQRIVCPRCRRVTPAGAYCANCGAALATTPSGGGQAPWSYE